MKIEKSKEFAPITIMLESKEELAIMTAIMGTNVSVPQAVKETFSRTLTNDFEINEIQRFMTSTYEKLRLYK